VTIDVLTIFPRLVEVALSEGVVARARESGKLEIRARDLRDFTDDKHRSVDDVPFGGGPGMVMKPEPIARAIEAVEAERGKASAVILMTPQGRRLTQADAERLSRMDRLVVICGRYEGVDERLTELKVTDEYSIGDYVLTGGELPALVLIDAVARLVPGVVGDAEAGGMARPGSSSGAAFRASRGDRSMAEAAAARPHAAPASGLETGEER